MAIVFGIFFGLFHALRLPRSLSGLVLVPLIWINVDAPLTGRDQGFLRISREVASETTAAGQPFHPVNHHWPRAGSSAWPSNLSLLKTTSRRRQAAAKVPGKATVSEIQGFRTRAGQKLGGLRAVRTTCVLPLT